MAERFAHPDTPFPIGVEYYRGGAPKPEFWDEDFANIRAAGFRIVRSASYWNWMEPARDTYQLDDYDAMFDLAAKHGLSMWLDVMLATHGAAPEWMTRDYPDFRVEPDAPIDVKECCGIGLSSVGRRRPRERHSV